MLQATVAGEALRGETKVHHPVQGLHSRAEISTGLISLRIGKVEPFRTPDSSVSIWDKSHRCEVAATTYFRLGISGQQTQGCTAAPSAVGSRVGRNGGLMIIDFI